MDTIHERSSFTSNADAAVPKKLTIELEQEVDGRWIADVLEVPGAMAYGDTWDDAVHNAMRFVRDVINVPFS